MALTEISEVVASYTNGNEGLCRRQLHAAARQSESPLEDAFWHEMEKVRTGTVKSMHAQVPMCGYRLDAVVVGWRGRHGVELDGKEFHKDKDRDYARDMRILSSGLLDDIIRVPFAAMHYYPKATMACLACWDRCFEVPQPITTMTVSEMYAEFDACTDRYGMPLTMREWLTDVDDSYDVYSVNGNVAWATSPSRMMSTRRRGSAIIRYTAMRQ